MYPEDSPLLHIHSDCYLILLNIMSDRVASLLSPTDWDSTSSTISINSRSSATIESPKQGGRQRDMIWPHFHDMGPAKTPGHRKAQCRYCQLYLNFAKLHMMYAHIAYQCEEIIYRNPQARKDIVIKMRDMENQPSLSINKKCKTDVSYFIYPCFHHLYTVSDSYNIK